MVFCRKSERSRVFTWIQDGRWMTRWYDCGVAGCPQWHSGLDKIFAPINDIRRHWDSSELSEELDSSVWHLVTISWVINIITDVLSGQMDIKVSGSKSDHPVSMGISSSLMVFEAGDWLRLPRKNMDAEQMWEQEWLLRSISCVKSNRGAEINREAYKERREKVKEVKMVIYSRGICAERISDGNMVFLSYLFMNREYLSKAGTWVSESE